jgi:hypothetical protein
MMKSQRITLIDNFIFHYELNFLKKIIKKTKMDYTKDTKPLLIFDVFQ